MKRRDLLKLPAAAPAAAGFASAAQPAPSPSRGRSAAPARPAAPAWSPGVFDAHQHATVLALLDQMIPATDTPGARSAQVDRYLDKLLADGPAGERHDFLQGLGWLDGFARRAHGRTFVRCSPARQLALLEQLESASDPDLAPGRRFVRVAKGWIARLYYATEAGFNELNKGGRVPATYACKS